MHCGAVGSTQHILPTANVLTQYSHEKPPAGTAHGHAESVFLHRIAATGIVSIGQSGKSEGSFLIAVGTLSGRLLQSYQSVSCLFSPKPRFVYKWWLYVKTFCLSSRPVFGLSFSTRHMHTDITNKHTTTFNCLVHCNMNQVFLLQSKLKAFIFQSELGVCADDPDFVMFFCFFWFKYCATWEASLYIRSPEYLRV